MTHNQTLIRSVDFPSNKHEEDYIISWTKNIVFRILNDWEYSIFSAMSDTSTLVKESMINITNKISAILNYTWNEPYGIFLFWSPSRSEMLPNSDLDIWIVHDENISNDDLKLIIEYFKTLPFDKIDIANWQTMTAMEYYTKTSIIEGNQAIDAKFIAGNKKFQQEYIDRGINTVCNGIERKFLNYICEEHFLHKYDYVWKITENWPNLKYDFWASRDLIFFNWYAWIIADITNIDIQGKENVSILLNSVEFIEQKFHLELKESIEIINLVKNTAVECSKSDNSRLLRYLNEYTIQNVFEKAKNKLAFYDINNSQELGLVYKKSKKNIQDALWILYADVVENLKKLKGEDWSGKYRKVDRNEYGDDETIELLKNNNDVILQNIALWKALDWEMNRQFLSELVVTVLERIPLSFANVMAILTKYELCEFDLSKILDNIFDIPGYEYLMRLVYRHPNSTIDIKKRLSNSKLIDAKYKSL